MLSVIRKKLFSYPTERRAVNGRRAQSRRHRPTSHSDSDSELIQVQPPKGSQVNVSSQKRRSRSLSMSERNDKRRNEKQRMKSNEVVKYCTKSSQHSGPTPKRANSLPAKGRKSRAAVEHRSQPKSGPSVEQLSSHKVATWLLDYELANLKERAPRHQAVSSSGRPCDQLTASVRPNVNGTLEKYAAQDCNSAPLSSHCLRDVNLSTRNGNFALGQSSVLHKTGQTYWDHLSHGLKSVWSTAESRPSPKTSSKNTHQLGHSIVLQEKSPRLNATNLQNFDTLDKKQMELKRREIKRIRNTKESAIKTEIQSDKRKRRNFLSNERELDKSSKSKQNGSNCIVRGHVDRASKPPRGTVTEQRPPMWSHIDWASVHASNLASGYIPVKRTFSKESSTIHPIQVCLICIANGLCSHTALHCAPLTLNC